MKWYKWKWWRFAKGFGGGSKIGDGGGIWVSIINTKFYWLKQPGYKFCSQCSEPTPAPVDPFELPVCGHCDDV